MSDAPSGKLKEQDLTNLDITKLTPSSPEVISRQATINIGTIGHVAHGKSTIVKAVSGVQTVRFKNELERNITIKLESTSRKRKSSKSNVGSNPKLAYTSIEQNLDNIDAALEIVENLKKNESNNTVKPKKLEKSITYKNTSSDCEMPGDQNADNTSNNRLQIDDATKIDSINCAIHKDENLKYCNRLILPSVRASSNFKLHAPSTENSNYMPNDAEELESSDVEQTSRTELDTALITIPSMSFDDEVSYKFVISNDMVKCFILDGKIFEFKNDEVTAYNPEEIDMIIDDAIIFGIHFYLIKWKNWSRGFNTWEQFNVLYKSQKLLFDYAREKHKESNMKCIDIDKQINGLHLMLSRKIISKLFDSFRNETGLCLPIINTDDLTSLLHGLDIDSKKIQYNREQTLKMSLATIALGHFRQEQLRLLKDYETDINVLTNSDKIKLENNIDLEGPPDFFIYSPRCVLKNISTSEDPPIGCNCKNNCELSGSCCNDMAGNSTTYNNNKYIIVPPGRPIFECNKKCKCTSDCNNRVVQLGSQINVCIYKTSSYGWGIRTKQDIKKGQFVSEYTGEVITVKEAEQRLKTKYSLLDHMWNLDFNDPNDYKYIVDGSHYANFTYFINHSCNANLNLFAVWINCLDLNLPHLALFASRDILAGEQLTTNYFSRYSVDSLKKTGVKCRCQMKNCKGYFF